MTAAQMALNMSHTTQPTRGGTNAASSPRTAPQNTIPAKVELSVGSPRCQCPQCGRFFLSPSAFDRHLTMGKDGRAICHDPATRLGKDGHKPMLRYENGWWITA